MFPLEFLLRELNGFYFIFYLNSPFSKLVLVDVDGVDFDSVGGILLIVGADHHECIDQPGSHTDLSDLTSLVFILEVQFR